MENFHKGGNFFKREEIIPHLTSQTEEIKPASGRQMSASWPRLLLKEKEELLMKKLKV